MFGFGCHARNSTLRVLYPSRKRGAGRRAATDDESGVAMGGTETPPAKLSACATCHTTHRGGEPPRAVRAVRAGRPGGQASRPTATGHDNGADGKGRRRGRPCHAPRRGAAAQWGHRALPQRDTTTGRGEGTQAVRTATGHGWGAGKGVWHDGAYYAGLMAVGRDVPIAPPG